MNTTKFKQWLRKPLSIVIAIALVGAGLFPLFVGGGPASALTYGEVSSRSIEMSSSAAGASASYLVSFNVATNDAPTGGIVVDFCSNDPIIGDSCTAPTGLSIGTPTVTGKSSNLTGTWTAAEVGSSASTLKYTTASPISTLATGATVSFTITSMTNPTSAGPFYARIYTFDSATDAGNYTATGTDTGLIDAGGVALYITNQITVESKVQEELTFCVATSATPCSCSVSCSNVTLGDTNGVLSTTGSYVDNTTNYTIQTNADSGAVVRMQGGTLCSGTESAGGATCSGDQIAAIGSTAAGSSVGSSQFGVCTSGSGTITPTAPYDTTSPSTEACSRVTSRGLNEDNGAYFAFNTTNTTSTYGDQIATATAGASATGNIVFLGNIAPTQQAGIYTTTLSFIATGTY